MASPIPPVMQQPSASVHSAFEALRELLADVQPACAVRFPDGAIWSPGGQKPVLTIVLRKPEGLRRLLLAGSEASLAEAYLRDDLDIEGDIFAVPRFVRALLGRPLSTAQRLRLAIKLARPPHEHTDEAREPLARLHGIRHSIDRDRAAVTHHYDVSNAFFQLFLDESLSYSCAVFSKPNEELAPAQQRKLDLICRKLRLRPGEHMLDIGCGWGALLLHAVREYGVEAVGITLSERQAQLARERIAAEGLAHRCRIEIADYRSVPHSGAFDKIASVGMFEHVGFERAPEYFAAVQRLLRHGGAYLHHAIVGNPRMLRGSNETLTQRYVFPDIELIPLGQVVTIAELSGLEVRDVENMREHYALTLRRWITALETHHDEVVKEVGEPTYRAWRLVFAGAADGFETCRQGVVQVLMVKPDLSGNTELPLLRNDWYSHSHH